MNAPPWLTRLPRAVDVDTLQEFDARMARRPASMNGWHLQSLDLRERSRVLDRVNPAGAVFLGCDFAPGQEARLRAAGALVFPNLPHTPFNTYRGTLYTGAELYAGIGAAEYEATTDAQIYGWSTRSGMDRRLDATLATALHDHAIGDALNDAISSGPFAGRKIVGVMGGHAVPRGTAAYDDAVRLGRLLVRAGYVVATGGGPGAMEAANLGAYLSGADEPAVADVVRRLAAVPGYRPSVTAWARAAAAVIRRRPEGTASLGIPTWYYGHEPPNLFATHIAKYFANSIREAVLLQRCSGGIVFLPGAGGTVQEIFQDACENYYATDEGIAPMVLVGRRHWTEELPVWPLLRALAHGRPMDGHVHLVETADEAVRLLT